MVHHYSRRIKLFLTIFAGNKNNWSNEGQDRRDHFYPPVAAQAAGVKVEEEVCYKCS